MKRSFMKSMLFSSMMFLALGLWSCSDNEDVTPDQDLNWENAVVSITSDPNAVFATSVDLKLNVSGVESYAYYIVEGEGVEEPLGEIIYRNATQDGGSGITPVAPEGAEVPVSIYGLEGGKTYTIFFAFKAGEDYGVKSQVVTTSAYSKRLTLISADKYKVKFHLSVGQDTVYRVGLIPADIYYSTMLQGVQTEADMLNYGGIVVRNDTTIEIKDGQPADPSDLDYGTYVIKPGSAFVLLAAQCLDDENVIAKVEYRPGEGGDGGGGMDPLNAASRSLKPDVDNDNEYSSVLEGDGVTGNPYVSEFTVIDGYITKTTIPGSVARIDFYTEAFKQVESKMTITPLTMNERTAKFSFMMGEGVVQYAAAVFTEADYNLMMDWVGEKGRIGYLLSSGLMQVASEPQELTITPMNENIKYKLLTIAAYDSEYNTVSYEERDFSVVKSDKPAPVMVAEHVKMDDPYKVAFRVKCTSSGDAACSSFKFAINDAGEWQSQIGNGIDDKMLIDNFGTLVSDPTILAKINSTEGYVFEFESNDEATSKFGIFGMNVDEKVGEVVVVNGTTPPYYGDGITNEELYKQLQGEWTATYKYRDMISKEPKTAKFNMYISDAPKTIPYNSWSDFKNAESDNYDIVVENIAYNKGLDPSTTEGRNAINDFIDDDIQTFKEEAKLAGKKYQSHSRLLMTHFDVPNASGYYFPYADPWDLYSDPVYLSYDIKELFYDFGPKMFLELAKDKNGNDSIYVNVDGSMRGVPPFSAWQQYTYNMMVYNWDSRIVYTPRSLAVDLSDDKKKITIMGIDVRMSDGEIVKCYPSPGNINAATQQFSFRIGGIEGIVLEKGAAGPAQDRYYGNNIEVGNITPFRSDGTVRAPRIPKILKLKKQATMAPVSLSEHMKSRSAGK